jgi:hypothetical protein
VRGLVCGRVPRREGCDGRVERRGPGATLASAAEGSCACVSTSELVARADSP